MLGKIFRLGHQQRLSGLGDLIREKSTKLKIATDMMPTGLAGTVSIKSFSLDRNPSVNLFRMLRHAGLFGIVVVVIIPCVELLAQQPPTSNASKTVCFASSK